jgi:hypothetical protein
MPWLASHVMWVTLLFVTAPVTFRFDFMRSVADALRHLPEVMARRRLERSLAQRTDRDVIGLFDARADRSDKRPKKRPA